MSAKVTMYEYTHIHTHILRKAVAFIHINQLSQCSKSNRDKLMYGMLVGGGVG
jgi:hypothetical protein